MRHFACSILSIFASLFLYFLIASMFSGCESVKYIDKVEVQRVNIPVKCDLPMPILKELKRDGIDEEQKHKDRLENLISIRVYIEELEHTLRACKGQK